jgi:uncharacterized caspase-like protein
MGHALLDWPARRCHEPRLTSRWVARLSFTAALCTSLLAGCASGPVGAPPMLALVIGNGAYENVVPLKNPVNDAADMCAALERVGFKTLCFTNVRDRAEFDAHIKEYVGQLGPNSVGVFYYSGHGVQAGNTNYLIPTQVQIKSAAENPTRSLYDVDDLFDRLGKKKTKFQLVILDACRADLFSPPPRQASRVPAGAVASRSILVRALEDVAGASNGLQPIKDAPPGTMVLYATASKDVAFDGEGRNGPLTKHVLQHVGTRGIYVEEFFKRVTRGVEQETLQKFRKRQTPFIYGSFSGRFCFAGCPGDNDVPIPPAY